MEETLSLPTGGNLQVWKVENSKRIQITDSIGTFLSSTCYVILYSYVRTDTNTNENFIFLWQGRFSSTIDRTAAGMISKIMDDSLTDRAIEVKIFENFEPEVLKSILPDKSITIITPSDLQWITPPVYTPKDIDSPTKLFNVISPSLTVIDYEEIMYCHYSSWEMNTIKLLDTPSAIYLWMGDAYESPVKREPFAYINHYFDSQHIEQDFRPIFKIISKREPILFTHLFSSTASTVLNDSTTHSVFHTHDPSRPLQNFSYEILVQTYPDEVDPTLKENYLEDEVFEGLFGMNKDAFHALPLWRQQAKKKELHLF